MPEAATNFKTGFFWGLGFTIAFVIIQWIFGAALNLRLVSPFKTTSVSMGA